MNAELIKRLNGDIDELGKRADLFPNERNAVSCLGSAVRLLEEANGDREGAAKSERERIEAMRKQVAEADAKAPATPAAPAVASSKGAKAESK